MCDGLVNCTNLPGNYSCSPCPPGYNGTGYGIGGCAGTYIHIFKYCFLLNTDINECDNNTCDALVVCTNGPGNYSCGPCPSGYNGTGYNTDSRGCIGKKQVPISNLF